MSARRIFVDGVACRARETNEVAGSVRAFQCTSDIGHDAESRGRERKMTGEPSWGGAARIDRRFRGTWAEFQGRRRNSSALQQRRSLRGPRDTLLAAALNPECGIGFVHPNVAWPIKNREDRRHALASRLVAVRCPGERPSGALATSILDARAPLPATDELARRRRAGADHQTHGAQSRLAGRVDAGTEAADVAASATMIRIGRGISASRIRRRYDRVGACIHGGTVDRCVRRQGATNTSHALIRRDRARRTDVARASRGPDATLVVVVSTRGHERNTNQDCGRKKTTLNRDAHADFPSVRTLPRTSERGNDGRERNMTGEVGLHGVARSDRRLRGTWAEFEGRRGAVQQRHPIREPRPLLAAALNPKWRIGFVHPNVAWPINNPEDRRHALASQFAAVRCPGVWVSGVSSTPVLDARTPLFTADVITSRRGVESDAETLRAQARLTRRVDAVAELADGSAATAVVRVRRGVSTSCVPRVAGVPHRPAVDRGVDASIDTDGSTHARHALVVGRVTGRADAAKTSRFADRALSVVVSACAGYEQCEHEGAHHQTINIRSEVSEEMTHFSGFRRSIWHAHSSPANTRPRGGLDG
jgi:hypothetical protein